LKFDEAVPRRAEFHLDQPALGHGVQGVEDELDLVSRHAQLGHRLQYEAHVLEARELPLSIEVRG
jgi:hypothetical protein